MRKFKKITAAAAAALMAASLSIPMTITASATDVSVDTASDAETHTYKAYQIFTGTYDATLGLTVTGWGSGINVAGLIADSAWTGFVVEDAVEASGTEGEEGYTPAKAAVTIGTITNDADGAATAAQKIEKINSNSAKADALARVIAKYITTSSTTLSNTAVDLDAGYYIVTDTYTSSDTDGTKSDSISKYILKVSGESTAITISPKKYKPSVTKKVWENQDDNVNNIAAYTDGSETAKNWNDVADYSIGDEIKFKLYGTLPSNLNSYTNGYKYVFHDEIDSQFTLIDGDDDSFVDVVVKIGDSVASGYKVKQTGNSFTVTFDNILSGNTISDPVNTLVTVEYSARLNNTANIGSTGQENKVYLEYSNNPNWDGNGTQTTDETPRDKVVVFTYEIDNTKIDGATKATLAGATFRLKNSSNKYAKVTGSDGAYIFNGWSDTAVDETLLTSADTGKFNIAGLDEGSYAIEEVSAPDGYNTLTAAVPIVVTATTDNGHKYSGTPSSAITKFEYTYNSVAGTEQTGDNISGIASGNIANNKGTQLPSTGGIGTKLFYIGGGAMVGIAGIALITKKRMGKKAE